MSIKSRRAIIALAGIIGIAAPAGAIWLVPWELSERQEAKTLADVQQGGYVIYLRHADRSRGAKEPFNANSPLDAFIDCTDQRNLTATGRAHAGKIGVAFRTLNIPVGRVVALPLCRTRETAQLAFGAAELDPRLYDPTYVKALFSEPVDKGNLVVVDTKDPVYRIADIILQPGEAAVFQPKKGGGFMYIGMLDQEDLDR